MTRALLPNPDRLVRVSHCILAAARRQGKDLVPRDVSDTVHDEWNRTDWNAIKLYKLNGYDGSWIGEAQHRTA